MQLVTLKIFESTFDAYLMKSKLDSMGIDSFIFGEYLLKNSEGFKLMIRKEDAEAALLVIEELENIPLTDENNVIIKCPMCNSNQITNDFKTFKNLKGILSIVASFVFLIFPFNAKQVKKCKQCSYEF